MTAEGTRRLHWGAGAVVVAALALTAWGTVPANGQTAEKASENVGAAAAGTSLEEEKTVGPAIVRDTDKLLDSWETTEEGIVWVPELDCALCHADAAESFASEKCIAPAHEGQDCLECHRDADGLVEAHKTCLGPLASLQTFTYVDSAVCLECHDQEQLVEATASYDGLTDSAGRTVNPHAIPSSEEHDAIECGDCHNMHKGKLEKTGRAANKVCKTCHHKNLYECGTCHE